MTDLAPLHIFRFHAEFYVHLLGSQAVASPTSICEGSFTECTGLEATMEPKVIKEGGRNYGAVQRAGPVTFATVILKRGIIPPSDLWGWFQRVNDGSTSGALAYRLDAKITLFSEDGTGKLAWKLVRALPIKFKMADLNASNFEVGIEELHLAHEGLYPTNPLERLQPR
ncbi:MAG: phage tail protein [Anaerolineae bacterium]|nr:phage tail protein [Anaerolineae bacterium]